LQPPGSRKAFSIYLLRHCDSASQATECCRSADQEEEYEWGAHVLCMPIPTRFAPSPSFPHGCRSTRRRTMRHVHHQSIDQMIIFESAATIDPVRQKKTILYELVNPQRNHGSRLAVQHQWPSCQCAHGPHKRPLQRLSVCRPHPPLRALAQLSCSPFEFCAFSSWCPSC
jgi:hypothetical protein